MGKGSGTLTLFMRNPKGPAGRARWNAWRPGWLLFWIVAGGIVAALILGPEKGITMTLAPLMLYIYLRIRVRPSESSTGSAEKDS